ncbi:prephenate dehydratase [Parabacteroides sp. PF5-5]|uniref:prephenate dehydratase n=1 Tax=unclassified Parabacteroides TaxID=2649774 RepID=UPI0024742991|nr:MULTISPECIES: prephenate dehydratase [unclassified Parabacteroides]MDH6303880.1 prephenate dehydratase [Parabacteroides sp. PH5-39]MDH6314497.1 prephenate dehydratase [Parabacteroides sp. PF5-13]MDH6318438.1 prephenate dehydratase [Parabacteroides sp. PH5-13]MDH6322269.1 prephenate dehydratase [Parabacteroides sp. PH5-8]MDH6325651.1 prephenate dehydratase [Parabacteroides sp. PH5-41]
MKKKVAIQGIAGSYHEIAAHKYFEDEEIEVLPCDTFRDVIAVIKKDPSVIGLMAIENTIAGSLLQNHELIRQSGFQTIGEYKLRISHSLAALPGTSIHEITEVDSHPIALMQCMDFLDTLPNVKIVEKDDTAASARWIAENQLKGHAAICSRQAAQIYGLDVLAEGIETNKHNFTRFLAVADKWTADEILRGTEKKKSSVVFALSHAVGSLSQVLSILSFYDMNLTKIQSLPIIGREWQYLFYIDLTFHDYMRYKQALDAVIPLTKDFVILGEYAEGKQSV